MAKETKTQAKTEEKKPGKPPTYRLVARKRGSEKGKGYMTLLAGWKNEGKFGEFTTFSKDNRITDEQLTEVLVEDMGRPVKEREYTVFLQIDAGAAADDATDFNFNAND